MEQKAILLGRFQPIHAGHVEAIVRTKLKYGNIHVFVGQAHETSERNPFDAQQMLKLLQEKTGLEDTEVSILPDLTNESDNSGEWSNYLADNIEKVASGYKKIFVCGVKDIDKSTDWFKDTDIVVAPQETSTDISATDIRKTYFENKERFATMDNLKTNNKRIWILGATGVGKSTLIRNLGLEGFPTTTEFEPASHKFVTSLTTDDYDNESTQTLIAGMKFAHVMASNAILHERTMLDNLAFFDNEKFKEATDYNTRLQDVINKQFENIFIFLDVDWETNKKQILKRGRKNELSEEALAYYENLNKTYNEKVITPLRMMGQRVITLTQDSDLNDVKVMIGVLLN